MCDYHPVFANYLVFFCCVSCLILVFFLIFSSSLFLLLITCDSLFFVHCQTSLLYVTSLLNLFVVCWPLILFVPTVSSSSWWLLFFCLCLFLLWLCPVKRCLSIVNFLSFSRLTSCEILLSSQRLIFMPLNRKRSRKYNQHDSSDPGSFDEFH